jgi:hypothetical protein
MGKAAKAHRAKVAKRNANMKQQEKKMQKLWQEAFEEQMKTMKEKFTSMSGNTSSGNTISENNQDFINNFLNKEEISNEESKIISELLNDEDVTKIMEENQKKMFDELKKEDLNEIFKNFNEDIKHEFEENYDENEIGDFNNEDFLKKMEDFKKIMSDGETSEEEKKIIEGIENIMGVFSNGDYEKKETTQEESEPTEPIQGE